MIEFDIDLPLEFEEVPEENWEDWNLREELKSAGWIYVNAGEYPAAVLVRCRLTNLQLIKLLREKTKEHNANN